MLGSSATTDDWTTIRQAAHYRQASKSTERGSASSTTDDWKVTSHTSNDRETAQSTKRRGPSPAAAHERKPACQATHNRQ